jgi:hypothetical protein
MAKRVCISYFTLGTRLQLLMDSQVEQTTYSASLGAISHCLHPPQHTYFTPFSGGRVVSLHQSSPDKSSQIQSNPIPHTAYPKSREEENKSSKKEREREEGTYKKM